MKKRTITAFQNASAADELRPNDRHGQVPVELELVDEHPDFCTCGPSEAGPVVCAAAEWWACPVCDGEEAPDVLTCARCKQVRT